MLPNWTAGTLIAPGSGVFVWWHFGAKAEFSPSIALARVDQTGVLVWECQVNSAKAREVPARVGDAKSNRVVVPEM